MIVKCAPPYRKVSGLAAHLVKTEENEAVQYVGARGLVAGDDLHEALREMAAQARGTRCQQPLYHVAFNAAPGEHLDARQWERCLSLWEQAAGLEDHQRVVVQHQKEGRWHTHAVYNRLDPETGKAVSVWQDHFRAKDVARAIEHELGLTRVPDEKPPQREGQRQAERWEAEQARRTGINVNEARDQILAAWTVADSGRAFRNALDAEGLLLAKGDSRAFLVVDGEGNFYALNGRVLPGERQASIRERLADVDPERLPTLEQAREQQVARAREPRTDKRGEGDGKGEQGRALTPDEALTETYRDQHANLNRRLERETKRFEQARQRLGRAHAEERAHEKDEAPRPWLRIVPVSKKARQRFEEKVLRKAAQREKELEALEARENARLSAIAEERAQLRRREKQERALLREFGRQAGNAEPVPPTMPSRPRSPEEDATYQRVIEQVREKEREKERQRLLQRQRGRGLGDD